MMKIIYNKLLRRIEKRSAEKKLYDIYRVVAFVLFSIVIIDSDVAYMIMVYKWFISVKLFILFNVFIFLDDILIYIRLLFKEGKENIEQDNWQSDIKIYSIPLEKILSFVYTSWWFKNKDFLKYVVCDNSKYTKIWQLLEDKEILIRWNNNSRILNKNISLNQAVELLSKTPIYQEWNNSYSFNPEYL